MDDATVRRRCVGHAAAESSGCTNYAATMPPRIAGPVSFAPGPIPTRPQSPPPTHVVVAKTKTREKAMATEQIEQAVAAEQVATQQVEQV